MDMKALMGGKGAAMPPDDPEESGERDAISAALDSIRQAVDDAERELMTGGAKPEDDAEQPVEGA